eukprot:SM000065S20164  [mRNA]  locus=s65:111544:112347:+ [translate_table: standard]
MQTARSDFACAIIAGKLYVAGGLGHGGRRLASAEVYDLQRDAWQALPSLSSERWSCFGAAVGSKFYVLGGRSRRAIGNEKLVDMFDPSAPQAWAPVRPGPPVAAVAGHTSGGLLCCLGWQQDERKLHVYDPSNDWWRDAAMPLGSARSPHGLRFRLASLCGELHFLQGQLADERSRLGEREADEMLVFDSSAFKQGKDPWKHGGSMVAHHGIVCFVTSTRTC